MAFYQDDDEEQQDPNAQQGGVATSGESGVIGASGSGSTTSPGASPNPSPNAPDRPGNFVGISTYLNANKPQAAKLGDQTAGVINTSADQARQGIGALQTEAQEKIKGTNALDQGIGQKLSTAAETLSGDERNTIKNTASAQYKGPQDETQLGGYQNAAKATNTAKSNIDNSGTEQGRMSLIGQVNSKPRTQGMNIFDNALLQAGGGREKLNQAATANADVKTGLDSTTQNIRGQIGRADDPSTPDVDESAGAIGQTNKAQADAYKKIQDAMGAWKTGFDPKVKQAQDALVAQQNAVTGDLGNNQLGLDQSTMDLLGLTEGQNAYGINFSNYLNPANVGDINASNVASAEDYARYAALADLAGEQNMILDPTKADQAGTAPKYSANSVKLKEDLAKADADYKRLYTATPAAQTLGGYPAEVIGETGALRGKSMAEVDNILNAWKSQGFPGGSQWVYQQLSGPIAQWKNGQKANNIVKKNT